MSCIVKVIDNAHGNTALRQKLRRLYRLVHHYAAGNDRNVAALADYSALAELKLRVLVVKIGVHLAAQAQVERAVGLRRVLRRPACRGSVSRLFASELQARSAA